MCPPNSYCWARLAYVLDAAKSLPDEPSGGKGELRFAGVRLLEALGDALRFAESRGVRGRSEGQTAPAHAAPAFRWAVGAARGRP